MGLVAYLSLSGSGREVGWGGRLFEAGRLLTFSAFRVGAYSRWALIRGWALIRINTVFQDSIRAHPCHVAPDDRKQFQYHTTMPLVFFNSHSSFLKR